MPSGAMKFELDLKRFGIAVVQQDFVVTAGLFTVLFSEDWLICA